MGRKPREESLPDLPEVPPLEENTPLPPQQSPGPIEEIDDFRDMNGIDSVLSDYMAQEKLDETSYRASLYKYDKINKQKQHLVDFSVGSVMSAHDIGVAMGSGEYRYVISWPNRRQVDGNPYCKAFKINIGETYDLKRMYANPPPLPGAGAPAPANGPAPDPINQALQLVGALVTLNRAGGQAADNPEKKTTEAAQSMLAFQTMMQQMSIQHLEFMKEVKRKFLSDDNYSEGEEEEDMEEENELVATVKELAIQFLPKLLGDGPGAKVTAGVVRSLPQFKKVVRDKPTLAHLLDELEKEFGKEKVTACCEKLKISRP